MGCKDGSGSKELLLQTNKVVSYSWLLVPLFDPDTQRRCMIRLSLGRRRKERSYQSINQSNSSPLPPELLEARYTFHELQGPATQPAAAQRKLGRILRQMTQSDPTARSAARVQLAAPRQTRLATNLAAPKELLEMPRDLAPNRAPMHATPPYGHAKGTCYIVNPM